MNENIKHNSKLFTYHLTDTENFFIPIFNFEHTKMTQTQFEQVAQLLIN